MKKPETLDPEVWLFRTLKAAEEKPPVLSKGKVLVGTAFGGVEATKANGFKDFTFDWRIKA